jgi:hypothetical protein
MLVADLDRHASPVNAGRALPSHQRLAATVAAGFVAVFAVLFVLFVSIPDTAPAARPGELPRPLPGLLSTEENVTNLAR